MSLYTWIEVKIVLGVEIVLGVKVVLLLIPN